MDKKQRPWFQFHLITLVLLTLSCGFLMWIHSDSLSDVQVTQRVHGTLIRYEVQGWPFGHSITHRTFAESFTVEDAFAYLDRSSEVRAERIALCILNMLFTLPLVGFVCEKLIRHCSRPKSQPERSPVRECEEDPDQVAQRIADLQRLKYSRGCKI